MWEDLQACRACGPDPAVGLDPLPVKRRTGLASVPVSPLGGLQPPHTCSLEGSPGSGPQGVGVGESSIFIYHFLLCVLGPHWGLSCLGWFLCRPEPLAVKTGTEQSRHGWESGRST